MTKWDPEYRKLKKSLPFFPHHLPNARLELSRCHIKIVCPASSLFPTKTERWSSKGEWVSALPWIPCFCRGQIWLLSGFRPHYHLLSPGRRTGTFLRAGPSRSHPFSCLQYPIPRPHSHSTYTDNWSSFSLRLSPDVCSPLSLSSKPGLPMFIFPLPKCKVSPQRLAFTVGREAWVPGTYWLLFSPLAGATFSVHSAANCILSGLAQVTLMAAAPTQAGPQSFIFACQMGIAKSIRNLTCGPGDQNIDLLSQTSVHSTQTSVPAAISG